MISCYSRAFFFSKEIVTFFIAQKFTKKGFLFGLGEKHPIKHDLSMYVLV